MPKWLESLDTYRAYLLDFYANSPGNLAILKTWSPVVFENQYTQTKAWYELRQKPEFKPKRVINA